MHSRGQCRGLVEGTREETRDRILLAAREERATSARSKEGRKTPNKYGTDALYDFVVVGQTVNTFMRLPQIVHRDVKIPKPRHAEGKRERISFLSINNLRHSVDDCHVGTKAKPVSTGNGDVKMASMLPQNRLLEGSLDFRKLKKTAPDGIQRRRWSDGGATMPIVSSDLPIPRPATRVKSPPLAQNSLNTIKSDTCIVQSADEILREFKEYAKRLDGLDEEKILSLSSLKTSEAAEHDHLRNKGKNQLINVGLPATASNELTDRHKPRRENPSKLNHAKNKKRVLVPSGVGSGSKNSSLERLPDTGRTGSSPMLLNRRSSRGLSKKFSLQRRSDAALRNKKIVRPDSPTSGPSQEEIQELQELPVIRKFLRMPKSRPKVVCFDYPGVDLTHMDVKRAIEKVIPNAFDSGKVVSIQFENVNVKLATGGLENRWLIELRDFTTRNLLIKNGLSPVSPRKNSLTDMKITVPKRSEDPGTSTGGEEKEEITFTPIKYPKKVQVKLNDTVAMEEYKLYLRRTAAEEKLQNVILLCAGRGDKLLTTML